MVRYAVLQRFGWLLTEDPDSTPRDVFERHDVVLQVFGDGSTIVVKNRSGNPIPVRDHALAIREAWLPFMSESERNRSRVDLLERELVATRDARDNWSKTHERFVRQVQEALGPNSTGNSIADIENMRKRVDARVVEHMRLCEQRGAEIEKLREQRDCERTRSNRMRRILNALWGQSSFVIKQDFAEMDNPEEIAQRFIADIALRAEPVVVEPPIEQWFDAWGARVKALVDAMGERWDGVTIAYAHAASPPDGTHWRAFRGRGDVLDMVATGSSAAIVAAKLEAKLRERVGKIIDEKREELARIDAALRVG